MNSLLIIDPDAHIYESEISSRDFADLNISTAVDGEQGEGLIASADIILGRPDLAVPLLSEATRLRWLQSTFAGIERFCAPGLRRDYILTGVKDIFGPLMSEYVFTYILAIERSLLETRSNQMQRIWKPLAYRGLSGLTIGIAGLGSIGRHIAHTASHFGMRVLGMSRAGFDADRVERVFTVDEKHEFLQELDYLVAILPETTETIGFFNFDDFCAMQNSARLISVGRGSAINQHDLIQALKEKKIGGAVLDVFEEEPLATANPLWSMENVYITPHNSACSFPSQIASIFCDNYLRFIAGKKLENIVDFDKGY